MPELPEVETVVRQLRPQLVGRRLGPVRVSSRRLRRPWKRSWSKRFQTGRRVRDVRRRGKWIVIDLDRSQSLLMHLGMSGNLEVWPVQAPVQSHTHLRFQIDGGGCELRFRDPRRFGMVWLGPTAAVERFFADRKLGPEPFAVSGDELYRRLRRSRRCLKALLLDQQVIAGVGNIYADEALFEAGLHPARKGESLTHSEAERLRRAIVSVLERAIRLQGATIRDFRYGAQQSGNFQNEFRVYHRTGEACVRCAGRIRRVRLAGRATHYCPRCQPAGKRRSRS